MQAKLIAHTQLTHRIHAGERDHNGLDNIQDLIAYCARVSNPNNQANTKTTPKLLEYLIKHKHWSPFEMASATIEVNTTRDIARQLLRHRSFSFQEFSQRYADIRDLSDSVVIRKARLQDLKNRQNSVITDDTSLHIQWEQHQRNVWHTAMQAYKWAIENGIAKEQARVVLPEGNTPSRLYVNGTIRSWIHYCELRSSNGTQLEHMVLAKEIATAIGQIYPKLLDFTQE
jgi:thymidylate synthase (FAD)